MFSSVTAYFVSHRSGSAEELTDKKKLLGEIVQLMEEGHRLEEERQHQRREAAKAASYIPGQKVVDERMKAQREGVLQLYCFTAVLHMHVTYQAFKLSYFALKGFMCVAAKQGADLLAKRKSDDGDEDRNRNDIRKHELG